jgi:hypothetical protein
VTKGVTNLIVVVAMLLLTRVSMELRWCVSLCTGGGGGAKVYDLNYYVKAALAGGICCSITHAAVCPLDVVKTRIQLEPTKYTGMVSGFRTVLANEVWLGWTLSLSYFHTRV